MVLERYFENNSIITNKKAEELGIQRHTLSKLVKEGKIERIKSGVYKKTNELVDDFVLISYNNNLVFSHQTALFLHDLSDRVPNIFHISVLQGYNVEHIKKTYENIQPHYVKKERFDIGVATTATPIGNMVKVYDKERTIVDIVLSRKNIDKQIYTYALQKYFKDKNKNVRNLIKYSKIFGIEETIRKYMEVLSW